MDHHELERERRNQQCVERLGVERPVCALCGEDDLRCLERHHIAGRAYDNDVAIACRNCHRKLSDDQFDHPEALGGSPTPLERIGHYLIGLAELFALLAQTLKKFGNALIETARELVSPSGEAPA